MFLLDTNVISELRRPDRANPDVVKWANSVPAAQSCSRDSPTEIGGSCHRSYCSPQRSTMRLVNASDGATRWSDTYDRERGDILVVESEIAAAVARELGLRMLGGGTAPRPHRGTHDIAAYELYVRGRDPIHFRSATDSGPLEGLALLHVEGDGDCTLSNSSRVVERVYREVRYNFRENFPAIYQSNAFHAH